jgi:threonine/homoserine/homoserine lactone efflux protein
MITFLSLVTSVKDYIEIVHKLIESDSSFQINNYDELGPIITYIVITFQEFIRNVVTLKWLNNIWDLPIIIPDISSAMISEISILDNYFHNAFNFLDKPLSYGETNLLFYNLEKFSIGLINSLFLFIPTGTSHLITIRRFVMQGLEAGYLAGLGSIVGNILWITSVIFGLRFFVIPWLSLDIFRYILGFVLLVKYMWDSYNERKMAVTTQSAKQKIFLLNFLLALTEQTSIYPFITNLSIGSESSILESFPAQDLTSFITIHFSYILGLTLGCLSLLHLTCWFWENPAFKIYMWLISSFKVSTSFYYKVLNFTFLYLTMICAISSIPYYGLDYTLTNPLGLVQDDRILYQPETLAKNPQLSFLGTKASDRNTRRNRGRHGRRERWKRRIRKYRTFDASLYDQGVYDLFTIEDLNYGFDRFWLRRKMRNHRVRFRFFPGPWMRSFKKQLAKPRLESYAGPRQEFFRILFEQVYHPSFHVYSTNADNKVTKINNLSRGAIPIKASGTNISLTNLGSNLSFDLGEKINRQSQFISTSIPKSDEQDSSKIKENLKVENSTLRKFVRKLDTRLKISQIQSNLDNTSINTFSNLDKFESPSNFIWSSFGSTKLNGPIYSKRWKQIFSKISHRQKRFGNKNFLTNNKALLNNFYATALSSTKMDSNLNSNKLSAKKQNSQILMNNDWRNQLNVPSMTEGHKLGMIARHATIQDQQILKYRSLYLNSKGVNENNARGFTALAQSKILQSRRSFDKTNVANVSIDKQTTSFNTFNKVLTPFTLFHPLKIYQKQQQAFEKKLHYYTPTVFRKFSIENNAPYFRVMMKRYFYYYKPTLRWERTMKVASLRKARRKTSTNPKKIQFPVNNGDLSLITSKFDSQEESILPSNKNNLSISDFEKTNEFSVTSGQLFNNFSRKTIPTHNYTIVGKRASRYRYQIYKDVLQHWYYTPFNRLLLKFDIDLFINRQPNSHFLTKNEENLLHLRRFLLSEHYNTLRWYTQMEHYRSMKTKIGGTKSFVSGIYNQQFGGTFKKIRHLFAITPSQQNQTILKFDQPLYNEYFNNTGNNLQKNLLIHEELLTNSIDSSRDINVNTDLKPNTLNNKNNNLLPTADYIEGSISLNKQKDLVNQSTHIIRDYLNDTNPIKQEYIKKLLREQNYVELTNFLYKGRKIRGLKPVTNSSDFFQQEKEYLLTSSEMSTRNVILDKDLKELEKLKFDTYVRSSFPTDLWVNLLKKWKRKINDQEFLKNYLQRRVEKREKRKLKKEKAIQTKLERLETLGFFNNFPYSTKNIDSKDLNGTNFLSRQFNFDNNKIYVSDVSLLSQESQISTGIQKSLNDGLLVLNTNKSQKNYKSAPRINLKLNQLKNEFLLKQEKDLNTSLKQLSTIINKSRNGGSMPEGHIIKINKTNKNQQKFKLKKLSRQIFTVVPIRLKNFYQEYTFKTNKILKNRVLKIFTKSKKRKDSFKAWQEKERTLNKQKRMRKEFKPLSKNPFKYDSKNYSKYLDQKTDIPLTNITESNFDQKIYSLTKRSPLSTSKIIEDSQIKDLSNSIFENIASASGETASKRKRSNIFLDVNVNPTRKKLDYASQNPNQIDTQNQNQSAFTSLNNKEIKKNANQDYSINKNLNWKQIFKKAYSKYFRKQFKRKRSPQRRVRVRKNRAVIKKRTLNDSLKRQFKNLRKYNVTSMPEGQKQSLQISKADLAIFSSTGSPFDLSETNQLFKPSPLQRRAKQKKQRFWKQKRVNYSQKLRKYKKRRRSVLGKIRILNKQLKKIKATNNLKVWWWKSFLPNLRATTDSLWQYEKDRQIQQKLLELSIPEILERDNLNIWGIDSQRESIKNNWAKDINLLQIGDFDYKPLALPEALKIRNRSEFIIASESMLQEPKLNNLQKINVSAASDVFENSDSKHSNISATIADGSNIKEKKLYENNNLEQSKITSMLESHRQTDTISNIAENYLFTNKKELNPITKLQNNTVLTNPIPFYAGWDESLRKFVVTNRLLSRRDSGYEMNFHQLSRERLFDSNIMAPFATKPQDFSNDLVSSNFSSTRQFNDSNRFEFTAAPLKGMNTATTLYWQIPFTTYDPDQFFALGMDGFAPLGWRRFQFRHSILKSWLYEKSTPFTIGAKNITQPINLKQKKYNLGDTDSQLVNTYVVKNKMNIITNSQAINNGNIKNNDNIKMNQDFSKSSLTSTDLAKIQSTTLLTKLKTNNTAINIFLDKNPNLDLADKNTRNIYRRLKKRYRRVKKHPRSPVWFPSGPLLNQVLPVHYIYIFYKRSRLPRDRYIKRRLVKSKVQTNLLANSNNLNMNPISDFTLRKRVKTKRKYHIKRDLTNQSMLIPRRVKFIAQDPGILRWRPVSRQKLTKPIADLIKEKRLLLSKQRKKELQDLNSKQPSNIRIKQLRRRVQRQIIRSVWRYKPRAGGFVWPGDYLKLELVKAPKLNVKKNAFSVNETNIESISNKRNILSKSEEYKQESLRSGSIKVKRKKKRSIQEWQIQPKKYLLQKHNYNVIKKKLTKAQRLNKIQERTKELSLTL